MPNLRHYEIVFLIHPDRSEQVPEIIQRYELMVKEGDGIVHRLENWGMRPLAYDVKKQSRANYVLMNIECDEQILRSLTESFRYSTEDILRNMVLKRKEAIKELSPIMAAKLEKTEEISVQESISLNEVK